VSMERVEESNDRADEAPGAAEELPVHGEDQSDVAAPEVVEEETGEGQRPAQEPIDVEALRAEAALAAGLADKLKRVEAEFVNETKRIRRQAEQDRKYAIEKVVVDLLPVVDALSSAAGTLGEDEAFAPMRAGLALVEKQMQGIFERYGIAPIEAQGQPFDPARHQAMMMVERPGLEPQTVCEVMRVGYELNGRVVRPAEVVVVKAPAPAAPETEEG
jgi:molecular chaperone GrpE